MIEIAAALIFAFCPVDDWKCYDTINNCAIQKDGIVTIENIEACITTWRKEHEYKS